jgi:hypothetical protein
VRLRRSYDVRQHLHVIRAERGRARVRRHRARACARPDRPNAGAPACRTSAAARAGRPQTASEGAVEAIWTETRTSCSRGGGGKDGPRSWGRRGRSPSKGRRRCQRQPRPLTEPPSLSAWVSRARREGTTVRAGERKRERTRSHASRTRQDASAKGVVGWTTRTEGREQGNGLGEGCPAVAFSSRDVRSERGRRRPSCPHSRSSRAAHAQLHAPASPCLSCRKWSSASGAARGHPRARAPPPSPAMSSMSRAAPGAWSHARVSASESRP